MEETRDDLREQVLRKCHITWDDERTNALVSDIMARADAELRDRLGIDDPGFDFTTGRENNLYVNWCYYAFNDSEDAFEQNFFGDIMQVRRVWELAHLLKEVDDADSEEG